MSDIVSNQVSDEEHLASLEYKVQVLRDRTASVAKGYSTGLFVWGSGGVSKSFTVESTLKDLGAPYVLTNSRLSARGMYCLLQESPDVVHLLDDCESLLDDKYA